MAVEEFGSYAQGYNNGLEHRNKEVKEALDLVHPNCLCKLRKRLRVGMCFRCKLLKYLGME